MKIATLGSLTGPVIVWGGAQGNLAALAALLREATRAGVPPAQVIGTGDLTGFAGQSAELVAAIRAFGAPLVAGDHERALAANEAASAFGPEADLRALWWPGLEATIRPEARDWMERLPDLVLFAHEGRRYAVIHGGFTDTARALWPMSPADDFREEIRAVEAAAGPVDGVFAGHCGIAFQRVIDGIAWMNAGTIGLAPDDGRPAGRYLRLDADGARILRLDFDPGPARAAMAAAGLPAALGVALSEGHWPVPEMLPEEMRRALRN